MNSKNVTSGSRHLPVTVGFLITVSFEIGIIVTGSDTSVLAVEK